MTPTPDLTPSEIEAQPTSETEGLKACPHCGGKAATAHNDYYWDVGCIDVECPMAEAWRTEAEAIAAWNRRQPASGSPGVAVIVGWHSINQLLAGKDVETERVTLIPASDLAHPEGARSAALDGDENPAILQAAHDYDAAYLASGGPGHWRAHLAGLRATIRSLKEPASPEKPQ